MRLPPPIFRLLIASLAALVMAAAGRAEDLFFSGFSKLTGASEAEGALEEEALAGQLQAGLEWSPSPAFRAFVHVIAQSDDGDSRRGDLGVAEAYLEGRLFPRSGRLRFRAGAFFLPTSFENVDALWENPYTISSSALNTWLGEELRPIGLDVAYFRGGWMAGATLYRGNDTFGSLPAVRGWTLGDRWTLLGQRVPVNQRAYASVSAENDGRFGWSARGGWRGRRIATQYSYVDNRSDGGVHGQLYNWDTRFHIVGAEYSAGDWTLAAEAGWGPTRIAAPDHQAVIDIGASYLLASRRLRSGRASVRVDSFDDGNRRDEALTVSYFWTPRGRLSLGAEIIVLDPENRARLQMRYAI